MKQERWGASFFFLFLEVAVEVSETTPNVCVWGRGGWREKKNKVFLIQSSKLPPLDGLIDRSVLPLLMITKVER